MQYYNKLDSDSNNKWKNVISVIMEENAEWIGAAMRIYKSTPV